MGAPGNDPRCALSFDTGKDCGKTERRYAFRKRGDNCVPIEYGVCGGSDPYFKDKQECEKTCRR
ncbi:Kunitz/Bovine pancreatic trypsin inhibitor domain protein [Ancylostoma ceylanicum]|uniref:Kunitz/Bovine pancreatic trypsin inhibitor domain protein n=1 Tax=Ancylostoma ceylanicum TaxID=53326 RepID=A0A0D6LEE8_9BILA|nr:Kunitz/Bovine pancreatic trypsin inhibitor domain protein [Ancylostoma ceylanicum]